LRSVETALYFLAWCPENNGDDCFVDEHGRPQVARASQQTAPLPGSAQQPSNMRWRRETALGAAVAAALALIVGAPTVGFGFVYDDRAAIITNRDATGSTPWSTLLRHDFWGADIRGP
jgi:hypothetical protein